MLSIVAKLSDAFKKFCAAYATQILILLCLFPTLLVTFENHDIAMHTTLNYFVGYETGFGGRKLIGTLCHLIMPYYISKRYILAMMWSAQGVMVVFFSMFVGRTIPCLSFSNVPAIMLAVVYMAGPFSMLHFISTRASVWVVETYMMVLTLSWLFVYLRYRDQ